MRDTTIKKKLRISSLKRGHVFYAALVTVGFFLIATASHDLIAGQREYAAARTEYDNLRILFSFETEQEFATQISADMHWEAPAPPINDFGEAPYSDNGADFAPLAEANFQILDYGHAARILGESQNLDLDIREAPVTGVATRSEATRRPAPPSSEESLKALVELNQDFVGWISVGGIISYPVVQGEDNTKYLNTTFSGRRNPSGAIFMDYRVAGGFDDPVCIIYGHNMKDGSMFARLHRYQNQSFMAERPYITITTAQGDTLTYRIFGAKITDARDVAYNLSFTTAATAAKAFSDAPENAERFLILSTCTNNANDNERLIVYAALE